MAETADIDTLAKGGRTNIFGFMLRLVARMPFLFIAGRLYGPDAVGRYAIAVVVVELAALVATLGLKRGLAQALANADRPEVDVVWDALAVAGLAAILSSAFLYAFPIIMFPHGGESAIERCFAFIIFAIAWSDVALAALAYRLNVKAAVTARAVIEPWTISIAVWLLYYVAPHDGLILAYMLAMAAALVASLVPLLRNYGVPHGWRPNVTQLWSLARHNAPLAGAEAIEWGTRNVDRFILGVMFAPQIVGIYYMAQQVSSVPQKLKSSFDPILGPVITASLARGDRAAIARQVRQVGYWIIAAQGGLALMASIPGEAVMGLVGPQFVAGTAALAFLLTAEVLAAQGAVAESALVYVARHRNLAISILMLAFQIGLSFALILTLKSWGPLLPQFGAPHPENLAAIGPAIALMISLALTSFIKSRLLGHLLGASVIGWRWPLLWASLAAIVVGTAFTSLPHQYEWAELILGLPGIAISYLVVLYLLGNAEDRALVHRKDAPVEAALPNAGAVTP